MKSRVYRLHEYPNFYQKIEERSPHEVSEGHMHITSLCPDLNANEIQIPYIKHHKVSSLVKGH